MGGFLTALAGLRSVRRRVASGRNRFGRSRVNYPDLSRRLRLEWLEDRTLLSVSMPLGPSAGGGAAWCVVGRSRVACRARPGVAGPTAGNLFSHPDAGDECRRGHYPDVPAVWA